MTNQSAPTEDAIKQSHLKWIWSGAAVITLLFGYGVTPWDVFTDLLENQGISDDNWVLVGYVAGYTLPLCVATGALIYAALRDMFANQNALQVASWVAVTLLVAAFLSGQLGLGAIPDFDSGIDIGGHPVWRFLVWIVTVYLNTYGIGLALSSVAIGSAAGITAHLKVPR